MKNILISLSLFFFCLCLIFPGFAAEPKSVYERIMQSKTIRCGYQVWPPAFAKDANTGKLSGINYDFMEQIGRELNLKVEWVVEVGSGDAVTALNSGKFDMMCTSMWPDAGRLTQSEYTLPTYFSAIYPYVRADDARFDGKLDLADVKDVRVGGIEGDITLDVAQKSFPNATHVPLPQTSDGSQLILSLTAKKMDMIFIDDPLADNYLKNNPGSIKKVPGVGAIRIFGEHLVLPSNELKLLNMMNVTIATLLNSGAMDRILARYEGMFIPAAKSFSELKK